MEVLNYLLRIGNTKLLHRYQEDKNGNITFSHFPKDFVMKRVEKMGILIPVDGERKQK